VPDVIKLIDQTNALAPEMIEAYELGERVSEEACLEEQKHRYSAIKINLIKVYYELAEQLRLSFDQRDEKALSETFKKMYAICPINGDPYYQIALLYKKNGDHENAVRYCENSLKFNGDHSPAQILMNILNDISSR
jgi:tetratricopeptide (TPR) repeat protein